MDKIDKPRLIVRFHAQLVPSGPIGDWVLRAADPQKWNRLRASLHMRVLSRRCME